MSAARDVAVVRSEVGSDGSGREGHRQVTIPALVTEAIGRLRYPKVPSSLWTSSGASYLGVRRRSRCAASRQRSGGRPHGACPYRRPTWATGTSWTRCSRSSWTRPPPTVEKFGDRRLAVRSRDAGECGYPRTGRTSRNAKHDGVDRASLARRSRGTKLGIAVAGLAFTIANCFALGGGDDLGAAKGYRTVFGVISRWHQTSGDGFQVID